MLPYAYKLVPSDNSSNFISELFKIFRFIYILCFIYATLFWFQFLEVYNACLIDMKRNYYLVLSLNSSKVFFFEIVWSLKTYKHRLAISLSVITMYLVSDFKDLFDFNLYINYLDVLLLSDFKDLFDLFLKTLYFELYLLIGDFIIFSKFVKFISLLAVLKLSNPYNMIFRISKHPSVYVNFSLLTLDPLIMFLMDIII